MKVRRYFYEDQNGYHYPDMILAETVPCSVDFSAYIDGTRNLIGVEWEAAEGLELIETGLSEDGLTAVAVVRGKFRGIHKLDFQLLLKQEDSEALSGLETVIQPFVVKVL